MLTIPPMLAILLQKAWTDGGPAVMQLIAIAQAHGDANDVAELNRQLAVDSVAIASIDKELARVKALLDAKGAK